ncbi:hypothetical protein [Paenibacillus phytohabitans]|uniref:hypothetical protein n=1 Tax=Paenibacillus phytohabitans TaxID=2654978 RepID=UPI00300804B6
MKNSTRLKYMKQIIESCSYQQLERDLRNTEGHHYFGLHRGIDEYLLFCRYDMPGMNFWYGPFDGKEPEYEAIVYEVWNREVLEKKTIKKGYLFQLREWTVIHLKKI